VANLWQHGGFFPNGVSGMLMAMAVIMFSFGGLELIGITAAEADNPAHSIPKATNQAIYRILIFYIGALGILLSLYPWQKVVTGGSPFVLIFHAEQQSGGPCAQRGGADGRPVRVQQRRVFQHPHAVRPGASGQCAARTAQCERRGVPVVALGVSALATGICVVINYLMPGKAFGFLMGLVVSALIINWALISWIHLRFRAAKLAAKQPASSAAPPSLTPTTCAWPSCWAYWW
jgi:aromatic amino acid transport protein AroP